MLVCSHCRTQAADVRNRISDEFLCDNCNRTNLEALEVQKHLNLWGQHGSTASTTDGTDAAEGSGPLGGDGPPAGDGPARGNVALDTIGAPSSNGHAAVSHDGPIAVEEQYTQSSDDTNTNANTNAAKFCIPECKFGGKVDKRRNTLTCSHCMEIFHTLCFYPENKDAPMVFTCGTCRKIPSVLHLMCGMMDSMQKAVLRLDRSYHELKTEFRNNMSDKDARIEGLTTENNKMTEKVAKLQSELDKAKWSSFRKNDLDAERKLLVGSSLVRDIDASRIMNTDVKSISSGKIRDVHNYLDSCDDGIYEEIAIVIGSNDCDETSRKPGEVQDILDSYASLLLSAKDKCSSVTVSSVCPRKKEKTQKNIDLVNTGLKNLCEATECKYVDNDMSFKLPDGSINDGYLIPGDVHLNMQGTNKLAKNLGVRTKSGVTDITFQNKTPHAGKPRNTEGGHKQERADTRNNSQSRGKRDSDDDYSRDNHNGSNACYNCGEYNHNKQTCWHKEPVTCHKCKRSGHKEKHCKYTTSSARY